MEIQKYVRYIIVTKVSNFYGVLDIEDGVLEYYTFDEMLSTDVKIMGLKAKEKDVVVYNTKESFEKVLYTKLKLVGVPISYDIKYEVASLCLDGYKHWANMVTTGAISILDEAKSLFKDETLGLCSAGCVSVEYKTYSTDINSVKYTRELVKGNFDAVKVPVSRSKCVSCDISVKQLKALMNANVQVKGIINTENREPNIIDYWYYLTKDRVFNVRNSILVLMEILFPARFNRNAIKVIYKPSDDDFYVQLDTFAMLRLKIADSLDEQLMAIWAIGASYAVEEKWDWILFQPSVKNYFNTKIVRSIYSRRYDYRTTNAIYLADLEVLTENVKLNDVIVLNPRNRL